MSRAALATKEKDTVCTIGTDGIVKVETEHNGVKQNKLITIDSFIAALKSNDESFEFPLFPIGLKKIAKKGQTTVIAIEYPEAKLDAMRYRSNTFNGVCIPRSIWISRLNSAPGGKYKLINTHIFALDMPLIGENQKVYAWPFPNFSVSFNDVCWGSDENIKQFRSTAGVPLANYSSLISMYFSANANDDLGWKLRNMDRHDGTAILNRLKEMNTFDVNLLMPDDSGMRTFSEVYNRMLNR